MNIESSHKFTRSGDTASGCIEGVNLEDYQVGVIGVNTEVVITDPPTVGGEGKYNIVVFFGVGGRALYPQPPPLLRKMLRVRPKLIVSSQPWVVL